MTQPRVTIFGTGGTISMTKAPGAGGVAPAMTAADLVASIPQLTSLDVELRVEDFTSLPGAALTPLHLAALARRVDAEFTAGADGVVITQGTDTIEEASWLLDLWHSGPQPVVITGAMRNPEQAGYDGPANLLDAITTAANPAAAGYGVLVAMAGQLHAARHVAKTHTVSTGAFTSPGTGPAGHVTEGRAAFPAGPPPRLTIPLPTEAVGDLPRVGIAMVSLGDDGHLLGQLPGTLDGLVVAAMGAGHVPAAIAPALGTLAQDIPVILASRTGAGPVLTATYGFPGSELDLISRGLIPAGTLPPLKARILLLAALAAGADPAQITAAFGAAGQAADEASWPWT